jgi:hypothetical protein
MDDRIAEDARFALLAMLAGAKAEASLVWEEDGRY